MSRREGYARMTVFGAQSNARTFDYQVCSVCPCHGIIDAFFQPGDIGYVPASFGEFFPYDH